MNLSQIVQSKDWNEQIKEEFITKLRRSPNSWTKGQNCAIKAYHISSTYPDEALKLIDYGIELSKDDVSAVGRLLSVKGPILENYKHDYLEAYACYTEWAKLKSAIGGHEFYRLRSLFRYKKLKADEEFINLFLKLKDQIHQLPSRDVRFWLTAMTSSAYEYDGLSKESRNFAGKAINIYLEIGPSLLNKMFSNLKTMPDEISVTKKELTILAARIFPLRSFIKLKPKKVN